MRRWGECAEGNVQADGDKQIGIKRCGQEEERIKIGNNYGNVTESMNLMCG